MEWLLTGAALLTGLSALGLLIRALGEEALRTTRAFDLLLLIGTLVLPLLSAFPIRLLGWDPLDYSSTGLLHTGLVAAPLALLAAALGLWWWLRLWWQQAALFYGIFTFFYTTCFTHGLGFFSGLVGSLGYWLAQQGVELGKQPLYYYALVQLPVYEYLPLLGTLLVPLLALYRRRRPAETPPTTAPAPPTLALLLTWSLSSLLAFSLAGERMPWLTVHLALPLLLSAGWSLGQLLEALAWRHLLTRQAALALTLTVLGLLSGSVALNQLFFQAPLTLTGANQPQALVTWLIASVTALLSGGGLLALLRRWSLRYWLQLVTVVGVAILVLLTARTAYRASFINYDDPAEYLVYAHGARDAKDLLAQIEAIGRLTGRGPELVIAYDGYSRYPFWWYLRRYPHQKLFTETPDRTLYGSELILVGESNYEALETLVQQGYLKATYIAFEYRRLVWPNQDYDALTWERVRYALTHPLLRQALFNIWLNRDYTLYAQVAHDPPTTPDRLPYITRMRLYVREDLARRMGYAPFTPLSAPTLPDPYQAQALPLQPDLIIGRPGTEPGALQAPRGLALAADGSLYVADTLNHRIQHFAPDGTLLHVWGRPSAEGGATAPAGTFREPWDVAVGPDGKVYVADTWNHRIQQFTATGEWLAQWGQPGQGAEGTGLWAPRGLAVAPNGQIFVADTGNKRVLVFSATGDLLAQCGTPGPGPGQLNEPVGLAVDLAGRIYVADTWNWRVQVFASSVTGRLYAPVTQWEIFGWAEQMPNNRAFIALDEAGHLYVTDPGGQRVLQFNTEGRYQRSWGQAAILSQPAGIAVDQAGHLWVSDAGRHQLLRFTLPEASEAP